MVISKRSIISPLPGDCDQKRQKKKKKQESKHQNEQKEQERPVF